VLINTAAVSGNRQLCGRGHKNPRFKLSLACHAGETRGVPPTPPNRRATHIKFNQIIIIVFALIACLAMCCTSAMHKLYHVY
jgi:hypothetical protein